MLKKIVAVFCCLMLSLIICSPIYAASLRPQTLTNNCNLIGIVIVFLIIASFILGFLSGVITILGCEKCKKKRCCYGNEGRKDNCDKRICRKDDCDKKECKIDDWDKKECKIDDWDKKESKKDGCDKKECRLDDCKSDDDFIKKIKEINQYK